ncbi:DUF4224 domain-containing protein [Xenorhabdus khoisanae]|uniref:DUF4224 domain-containing protein n=1 Tax=Xenorhabdus khoisanae TaxID=880157 RepID=UPI00235896A3|nr:DUF4224 domain-containing protein [Xenorhabdus khoisanae]MDC9615931.1 DUF4224 domain-containing protein [Xenorhabdus khoisanae]
MEINRDIITDEEMEELTGYQIPSKQCEVLAKHGIFFITRQDNKPRTTWTHFNNPMIATRYSKPAEEPDFENM